MIPPGVFKPKQQGSAKAHSVLDHVLSVDQVIKISAGWSRGQDRSWQNAEGKSQREVLNELSHLKGTQENRVPEQTDVCIWTQDGGSLKHMMRNKVRGMKYLVLSEEVNIQAAAGSWWKGGSNRDSLKTSNLLPRKERLAHTGGGIALPAKENPTSEMQGAFNPSRLLQTGSD